MIYQGKNIIGQYLGAQSIVRKYLGDVLFWENVSEEEEWTLEAEFYGPTWEIEIMNLNPMYVERMNIDGVDVTPTKTYLFGDYQTHTVKYKITSNNVPVSFFYENRNVQSVKILKAENVGSAAFYNLSLLFDVYISKHVKSIAKDAFDNTPIINKITVEEGNTAFYPVEDGSLVEIATNRLIRGTNKGVIPEGVVTIGQYAFYKCMDMTGHIVIPDSVETIELAAFGGCSNIPSLTLGSSVDIIGQYAFAGCSKLSEITFRSKYFPSSLAGNAFDGIPEQGAIYYPCGSAYNIFLDDWAEIYWGNWTRECFTEELEVTDYDILAVFDYVKGATTVLGSTDNIAKMYVNNVEVDVARQYTFPSTAGFNKVKYKLIDNTRIGEGTFSHCMKLTSIELPDTLTVIDKDAFFICENLSPITIPESVTSIGNSAFMGCMNFTEIIIPQNVTSIGDYAFEDCGSLESITCNATTAPALGNYAFRYLPYGGILYYPKGSDYSSWLSTESDCLGDYGWTGEEL